MHFGKHWRLFSWVCFWRHAEEAKLLRSIGLNSFKFSALAGDGHLLNLVFLFRSLNGRSFTYGFLCICNLPKARSDGAFVRDILTFTEAYSLLVLLSCCPLNRHFQFGMLCSLASLLSYGVVVFNADHSTCLLLFYLKERHITIVLAADDRAVIDLAYFLGRTWIKFRQFCWLLVLWHSFTWSCEQNWRV